MFVPKITLSNVPVDASSVLITDITGDITDPTPDTTGYDLTRTYGYYPYSNLQWRKLIQAQYLGGSPSLYPFSPISDWDTTVSGTVPITLTDGIWLFSNYFVWSNFDWLSDADLDYTIDVTRKILTKAGGATWVDSSGTPGIFSGVYAISISSGSVADLDDICVIESATSTTVTLKTALPAGGLNALNFFYRAQKYLLVMNVGEQSLISDIGDMAISALAGQGCDRNKSCELAGRMILKLAAQVAFNCGNYAKAHNAAILFNKSVSANSSNCTSC